ncbi:hypothetical protein ACLOJK_007099 [Asimina triloba]
MQQPPETHLPLPPATAPPLASPVFHNRLLCRRCLAASFMSAATWHVGTSNSMSAAAPRRRSIGNVR